MPRTGFFYLGRPLEDYYEERVRNLIRDLGSPVGDDDTFAMYGITYKIVKRFEVKDRKFAVVTEYKPVMPGFNRKVYVRPFNDEATHILTEGLDKPEIMMSIHQVGFSSADEAERLTIGAMNG